MRARVQVFVRACLGECVAVDTNATILTIEIFLLRIMFFFCVCRGAGWGMREAGWKHG